MDSVNTSGYLQFNPNTLENVRKLYDLDKPGAMADAVDILVEWMKKQEHFVKKDFDRDYLERTIIRAKGSLERTKHRLDKLCTAKTHMLTFFVDTNVKEFTHLDHVEDLFLPKPTADNYRIYLLRNRESQFDSLFFTNYYRRVVQYFEYMNANDYSNGLQVILDYRETNLLAMVTSTNMVEMQSMARLTLECYGVRIKGIHLISSSKIIEMVVTMLKQILSAKLSSRIYVHNSLDSLYEHLDKDLLPVDYGGKERPLSDLYEQFQNEISSAKHVEYMKMMNAARTNETYRPTATFNEQCLGMPGTFRALRVD